MRNLSKEKKIEITEYLLEVDNSVMRSLEGERKEIEALIDQIGQDASIDLRLFERVSVLDKALERRLRSFELHLANLNKLREELDRIKQTRN